VKALARTFLLLATLGGISVRAQSVLVKNIVLVHGAWADGSGWKGVHDILVKDGFNVSIVQEPETSFKDDVAATKRVLARQEGPCILVAHSYGVRSSPPRETIRPLSAWSISPLICRTPERKSRKTESVSQAI